jgi:RimJ/RimL family protein N-acetyltransferase
MSHSEQLNVLRDMKNFPNDHSLQLVSNSTNLVFCPVGNWLLTRDDILSELAMWRHLNARFFPSQFPFSVDSMRNYIVTHSIGMSDRLLFLIFNEAEYPVGHLGISHTQEGYAEIDNVMRNPNSSNFFMRDALAHLMQWAELELGVKNFGLSVMSNNPRAIGLYKSLGFNFSGLAPNDHSSPNELSFSDLDKPLLTRMLRATQA